MSVWSESHSWLYCLGLVLSTVHTHTCPISSGRVSCGFAEMDKFLLIHQVIYCLLPRLVSSMHFAPVQKCHRQWHSCSWETAPPDYGHDCQQEETVGFKKIIHLLTVKLMFVDNIWSLCLGLRWHGGRCTNVGKTRTNRRASGAWSKALPPHKQAVRVS